MNNEPIQMGREYQTRDGRPVRVLCVDYDHPLGFPVVALTKNRKSEMLGVYRADGTRDEESADLIPVPRKFSFKGWVNICRFEKAITLSTFTSRHGADRYATENRIACIEVEISGKEGDGL